MSTLAQITANRANAQHSTGPVSVQGKAAAAQNARQHGFTSRVPQVAEDQRAEFESLEAGLRLDIQPAGCLQEELFHRVLTHTWNLRRIEAVECGVLAAADPAALTPEETAKLTLFGRYRRDLERGLFRALQELRKLQADTPVTKQSQSAAVLPPGPLVQQHPRRPEAIPQHGEACGEERLLNRHEDLPAAGEQGVQPLHLLRTVQREG